MSHDTFQFIPRPEAKAMEWNHLISPVQNAVRELIVILAGAVGQSRDKDLKVANCFLVNGERGTGKTSVLLNAGKAITDHESFFNSLNKDQQLGSEARTCAKKIKEHAIWLDVLDLEPLQAETNLLTTVLTCIRKALTQFDGQSGEQEITSLFEASPNSARPQLEQLIGDATLMWESIKEQDTRNIANRQVAAAGIYAKYKELFRNAIDKLTEELGRPYGKNTRLSIILPIDNIDRSTEHLYNIVKLAQLVSHSHLWLVMAGGREDISTFLERAYWKELISNCNSPSIYGALGRTESNGEDETLTMARRQAAATSQKIWPSSHRIVVPLMQPEQTLGFKPPSQTDLESIEDLLSQVNIPTWLKNDDKPVQLPFIALFEHIGVPFGISDLKNSESKKNLVKGCLKLKSIGDFDELSEELISKCRDAELEEKDVSNELVVSIIDAINKILAKRSEAIYGKNNQAMFKDKDVELRDWVEKECKKKDNSPENPWTTRFLNKAVLQDIFSDVFSRPLTLAARNGLKMPARSVIELWQTANWVVHDEPYFNINSYDKVEQIIRTMLRNAIEESSLSSRISRSLQETVIRKCTNGGTLLNFRKLKLEVECVAPNDTEIRIKEPNDRLINPYIQSCIRVKSGNESFRRFILREEANEKNENELEEELPEFVSAWLSVLYDVLAFADRLAILRGVSLPPPNMATRHTVVMDPNKTSKESGYRTIEEELVWLAPAWSTFRSQSLFWRSWTNFQLKAEQEWSDNVDGDKQEQECGNDSNDDKSNQTQSNSHTTINNIDIPFSFKISCYLVMGWLRCVLDSYADMHWYSGCNAAKQEPCPNNVLKKLPALWWPKNDMIGCMKDINTLGYLVMVQAAVVHSCLSNCMDKPLHQRKHFDIQAMLDWLEIDLPMFFSPWYMPIDNSEALKTLYPFLEIRFEKYIEALKRKYEETPKTPEEPKSLQEELKSLKDRGSDLTDEEIKFLLEATNKLAETWSNKIPFIVATLEDRIALLFKPKEGMTDTERVRKQQEHQYFLQEINKLCSLHKYIKKPPAERSKSEDL